MTASKRKPDEKFEDYRNRLKKEAKDLKEYLKGNLVWCSSMIIKHPKDDDRLVKVKVRGTKVKSTKARGTHEKGDK